MLQSGQAGFKFFLTVKKCWRIIYKLDGGIRNQLKWRNGLVGCCHCCCCTRSLMDPHFSSSPPLTKRPSTQKSRGATSLSLLSSLYLSVCFYVAFQRQRIVYQGFCQSVTELNACLSRLYLCAFTLQYKCAFDIDYKEILCMCVCFDL